MPDETLKLIVPAHRPIKKSTLSHILKQARLTVEEFEKLL
jgi:predicted RNA binding protein YcfA (HicA-like mRNA interferase family)